MSKKVLLRLTQFALLFALIVTTVGAYVRLSDAGLGCPDWPGCFGHLVTPTDEGTQAQAQEAYPERRFEYTKAIKEMNHRYIASTLGLMICAIAFIAWRRRKQGDDVPLVLPVFLVFFVIFQGLLGKWTVTLLLHPAVVMAHLLGGFTTLSLLLWLKLQLSGFAKGSAPLVWAGLRGWVLLAATVVVLQIALGGWTASNYAALACPDFPTCQNVWLPQMDFKEGFSLFKELGVDYEFGRLDSDARVAIHFSHRLGAIITLLVVGGLALRAHLQETGAVKRTAAIVLSILVLQLALGVSNIVFELPLPVAVAHNAVGALLLLSVVTWVFAVYQAGSSTTARLEH